MGWRLYVLKQGSWSWFGVFVFEQQIQQMSMWLWISTLVSCGGIAQVCCKSQAGWSGVFVELLDKKRRNLVHHIDFKDSQCFDIISIWPICHMNDNIPTIKNEKCNFVWFVIFTIMFWFDLGYPSNSNRKLPLLITLKCGGIDCHVDLVPAFFKKPSWLCPP